MDRWFGRYSQPVFAVMRIVVGALFSCHGAQKLFGVLGGHQVELASLLGLAGIIEFGGGVLVALGLFASVAAFIASGEMATAYFLMHLPRGPIPILNAGEPAVVYCFVMLFIAAHGPGPWSLDAVLRRRP